MISSPHAPSLLSRASARTARSCLLVALLLTIAAGALPAQRTQPSGVASLGRPLAGALLGGAAGALAGGIAGLYIGGNRCSSPGSSDTCLGLEGLAVGTVVGFTLGAPVGAYLLDHRRGSLPTSLLASVAIGGAGVAALAALERNVEHPRRRTFQVPLAIAVPVFQVVTAAIIERRTSGR